MNKVILLLIALGIIGGNLFRLQFNNGVAINFLDIAVACAALKGLYDYIQLKKRTFTSYEKAFGIFLVVALLSLGINALQLPPIQLLVSSLYLFRFVIYIFIYVFFRTFTTKDRTFSLVIMFSVGISLVVIGFIQYLFYSNLRNLYYLGWDEHLYRMFSTFLDPNFAGSFFVLFEFFLLGAMIKLRKHKTRFYILSVVSLFTFVAIFLTYSRSAFLMLCTGLLTSLLLTKYKKIVILLLLVSFMTLWLVSNTLIESKNPFRLASSHARLDSAKNAVIIISHYPILGVGFNAYRYAQERLSLRDEHTQYVSHADSGTDSSLLFVTATTGVVGLLLFCNFLYKILQRSYELYHREKNILAGVFLISVSALLINSIFINSLFYPMILVWIVMLFGVMENT